VGLLIYPQVAQIEQFDMRQRHRPMTGTGGGYFTKVGRWLKESW
jgi:cell division protein FtsA